MIDFQITGEGQVLTGLVSAEAAAVKGVRESVARQTLRLLRHIKEEKLTGQVLKVRSGTLRRSIAQRVTDNGAAIVGEVSTPLVYAPPHEFGVMMKARIVEAKRVSALKFQFNGKTMFRKRVTIPAYRMPERSFMRSALEDLQGSIVADIAASADVDSTL